MKTHNRSLKMLGASVCLYGAAIAYPVSGQETIAPLVVDADGKPICGEWLEMLKGNRSETVVFTGSDKHGQKVKVLVDGQKWRFVILAGAEDPRFGCEIMAGDGFSAR